MIELMLNITQCGFRPGRSTTEAISLSSKFLRNVGICQRRPHMLCRPRESTIPDSSRKACCGSTVLKAACYWSSSHCIPAQKFVSMSEKLNHDRSPLVLDTDKGVCCHRSISESPLHKLDRQSQPSRQGCHT